VLQIPFTVKIVRDFSPPSLATGSIPSTLPVKVLPSTLPNSRSTTIPELTIDRLIALSRR
jgi:hypothetical protein